MDADKSDLDALDTRVKRLLVDMEERGKTHAAELERLKIKSHESLARLHQAVEELRAANPYR